jgi:hypothetical protein
LICTSELDQSYSAYGFSSGHWFVRVICGGVVSIGEAVLYLTDYVRVRDWDGDAMKHDAVGCDMMCDILLRCDDRGCGWLDGWMAGWLDGWMAGWLAGRREDELAVRR